MPGPRHRLGIDQLLAAAELSGGDVILHLDDDHRDDLPGHGNAGHFGNHAAPHDLRFDLSEAGDQGCAARAVRDQDAAGREIGLTISPTCSANCSTRPVTPARMTVLSRST